MLMRVRERQNEVHVDLTGVAGRQERVLAALSACRSCNCTAGIGATALTVRARSDGMQVRMRASNGQTLDVVEIYRCLRRALIERTRGLSTVG